MRQRNFNVDVGYKLAMLTCISSPVAMYYIRHFADVDRSYIGRALAFIFLSFITSPLRLYERSQVTKIIETTPFTKHPIFILGHWRSGTTFLHNLMCQDKNYGYVSSFQAIAPDFFLVSQRTFFTQLLRLIPPTKRPEDNVIVALDDPQEEEIAMAKASPYSSLHQMIFPLNARNLVHKYCLMSDLSDEVYGQWKEKYLEILCKARWQMGNRRLILKNPANTGRVKTLLTLFPKAKFVHLYRNPYVVFLSMCHYYRTLLPLLQLQKINQCEIEANILLFYKQILQKFLRERQFIPTGNLVEIRFENLEANPIEEVHHIYQALGLPGFSRTEETFQEYIESQTHYQKNNYILTDDVIQKVNKHWRFAFNEWSYDLLGEDLCREEDQMPLTEESKEFVSI
jgi:hypothetical protein